MKVRCLANSILVIKDPKKEKTDGGIILATYSEDPEKQVEIGTIVEIGPDVKVVKIGDRVLYSEFDSQPVDKDSAVITVDQIVAVVEEE